MCGVAGIVSFGGGVSVGDLKKMVRAMAHRGPDDEGYFADDRVGFAHRRLSIIDLSSRGRQPMGNEDGSVWITYNGEVYNFQRLRGELEGSGHEFHSGTDTEVIVHGYEEWGLEPLLERFVGMWAFALYDSVKGKVYLVRDRFGKKPLYYSFHDGQLVFASELKAILSLDWVERRIDRQALWHYLSFLTVPAPRTLVAGICKVPAGHYLEVDLRTGKHRLVRYYDVFGIRMDYNMTEAEALKRIERLLISSVRYRNIADVPVGVFLSGGVDSSLITAINSRVAGNVRTFSVVYDDPKIDESKYSSAVAELYSTEHHTVHIGEREIHEALDLVAYYQDEPIGDPVDVPIYYLSQLARERGVTVVHVGEGADELFMGYGYYEGVWKLWPVFRTARKSAFFRWLANVLSRMPFRGCRALADIIRAQTLTDVPVRQILAFSDDEKTFLKYSSPETSVQYLERLVSGSPYPSSSIDGYFYNMRATELKLRLPELLFMRVDKFTMAASLEARLPYMDARIVDLAFSIPPALHMKKGVTKYLLKKIAVKYLPKELVCRRKVGFGAPVWTYMDEFSDFFMEKLRALSGVVDISSISLDRLRRQGFYRAWALFNLAIWYERWFLA